LTTTDYGKMVFCSSVVAVAIAVHRNEESIMNLPRIILSGMLTACFLHSLATSAEDGNLPKPTSQQLAWQEAEIGVLVCYELHTFNEGRYHQGRARIDRIAAVEQFNPPNLDTDQWIKSLKAAGIGFAILTVSHESGFRLWQSEVNPYCLKSVKWGDGKRDIFKEFVDSCRKYGVKPGVYMGTRWNAQLGVYDFKVTKRSTITQQDYNDLIEKEVAEICSKYGELFEIWFDGGGYGPDQGGPDVLSVVEKHQPNIHFYHNHDRADSRWGGSESGTVPYPCWATMPFKGLRGGATDKLLNANGRRLYKQGDPDGKFWCPAMSDAPLRGHGGHEWFWEPGDERLIYPLKNLFDMYINSVGRNSTLLLGVTPDTNGVIPAADAKRLKEFGDALKRVFGKPLAEASGTGTELLLETKGAEFNYVVLQEDIREGERVRNYVLEIMQDGTWQPLAKGTCIGHKRIHYLDAPVTTSKVRLRITKAAACPAIREFTLHREPDWSRGRSTPEDGLTDAIVDDGIEVSGKKPKPITDETADFSVMMSRNNAIEGKTGRTALPFLSELEKKTGYGRTSTDIPPEAFTKVLESRKVAPANEAPGKTQFHVYIPKSVKKVKAAFYISCHGMGEIGSPTLHKFAEDEKVALVGLLGDPVQRGLFPVSLLDKHIKKLAVLSGHPELTDVPIITFGHSNGTGFAACLPSQRPDRVIAWISFHSGYSNYLQFPNTEKVPALIMHGMRDDWFKKHHQDEAVATMRKKRNAAMGMMMEGSVGHAPVNKETTWSFIVEFCKAAIRVRLGEDGTLKPVNINSGWLGAVYDTELGGQQRLYIAPYADFKGDPSTANWLPNKEFAWIWQVYGNTKPEPK